MRAAQEEVSSFYKNFSQEFPKVENLKIVSNPINGHVVPFLVNDGNTRAQFTIRGRLKHHPHLSMYGNYSEAVSEDGRQETEIPLKNELRHSSLKFGVSADDIPADAIETIEAALKRVNQLLEAQNADGFSYRPFKSKFALLQFQNPVIFPNWKGPLMLKVLGRENVAYDPVIHDSKGLFMLGGIPNTESGIYPDLRPRCMEKVDRNVVKNIPIESLQVGDLVEVNFQIVTYKVQKGFGAYLYAEEVVLLAKSQFMQKLAPLITTEMQVSPMKRSRWVVEEENK